MAWTDERDDVADCMTAGNSCAEEEYYRRFDVATGGWGTETRLTFDAAGNPKPSWAPSIAVSQGAVHLAFFDARSGPFHLLCSPGRLMCRGDLRSATREDGVVV